MTKRLHATLFFLLFGLPLWAQPGPQEEPPGFHGSLSLGIADMKQTSLSQEQIDTYDDDPETTNRTIPLPRIQLRYVDDDKRSFWFLENAGPGLKLGRKHDAKWGTVNLAIGASLPFGVENEYQNPYLLEEKRETTGKSSQSASLSYDYATELGIGGGIGLENVYVDYWQDDTEDLYPNLGRDSVTNTVSANLRLWFVQVQHQLQTIEAHGEADSGRGIYNQAQVVAPIVPKRLMAITQFREGVIHYETQHPIFLETRKDNVKSSMVRLMWLQDPYQFFLLGTGQVTDSNLNFFDAERQTVVLGAGWSF